MTAKGGANGGEEVTHSVSYKETFKAWGKISDTRMKEWSDVGRKIYAIETCEEDASGNQIP